MHRLQVLAKIVLLSLVFGCGDPFSDRRHGPGDQPPDDPQETPAGDASVDADELVGPILEASPGIEVSFEPPASPSGVAPISRVHLRLPEIGSPQGAILVSGSLSKSQLRDISRGTISKTVGERRVEALIWRDLDDPRTIVTAPLSSLLPGETYTLALAQPSTELSFLVAQAETETWRRIWPLPMDAASSANFIIYCGDEAISLSPTRVLAEPGSIAGTIESGIGSEILDAPSCLRWDADQGQDAAGPHLLPPAIELGDGRLIALEPTPLIGSGKAPGLEPLPCPAAEIPLGPSCVEVDDDRIIVRPSYWSALWAVRAGDASIVQLALEGARFPLRPLPPSSLVEAQAVAIDAAGRIIEAEATIETKPARAHLVINEVMAAPKGPEPAQEWIEILNDGSESADLGDYQLDIAGFSVDLPSYPLEPGAFALIVSEAYVLGEGSDAPPASGTYLLRVPKLGNRGLTNSGQVISLLDKEGAVVSRFSATPKPQKGVSVIRVRPDALDELPSSFAHDPNGSSSPGSPNPWP